MPPQGQMSCCREVGHMGRFCPQRDGCSKCGEGGHVRLDWPSRVECRLCGNLGHLPEDCPSIVVVHPSVAKENKALLSEVPYYNCRRLENYHSPFNSLIIRDLTQRGRERERRRLKKITFLVCSLLFCADH